MNSSKITLYYHTLKHLKRKQLVYQVYYRVRNKFYRKSYQGQPEKVVLPKLIDGICSPASYMSEKRFTFLNLEKYFDRIDWNYKAFGKLWTYNLNYFDFLQQDGMTRDQGLALIRDFNEQRATLKDGLEPYPISLRGINWIKFLVAHQVEDTEIDISLYRDYQRLKNNLEYHLLANHLLENAFSLLFGAYYFRDQELYEKASHLLTKELTEQILRDGAHYERSPMYHQIILHRLLDSINLLGNNPWQRKSLLNQLEVKAAIMLGWLEQVTFSDGEIPYVNDATAGIAPSTAELSEYAARLGIEPRHHKLRESCYRVIKNEHIEVLFNIGGIAPSYQPGHAHADHLQFLLHYKGKPVLVDTGISTYEKNARRQHERSTSAHNTVVVDKQDSSQVWGGFRVGKRAKVRLIEGFPNRYKAYHNGYRELGVRHRRSLLLEENTLLVTDKLHYNNETIPGEGHLHFHPRIEISLKDNCVIAGGMQISFDPGVKLRLEDYEYAAGFNKLVPAKKVVYVFKGKTQLSVSPLRTDQRTIDKYSSGKEEYTRHFE